MQLHGTRESAVSDARIVAASPSYAIVRVRVTGPAARLDDLAMRWVAADGDHGRTGALPPARATDDDGRLLAFALPLPVVRSRPRQLSLVDGVRSWPVPWSPPDPLLPGGSRATVPERVHTGMAFRGAVRSTWHVVIGGAAWSVYLSEMLFQSTVGLPAAWEQLVGAVAVAAFVIGVLAVAWVGWNVLLHRRHGERRTQAPILEPSLERDALGRRIVSSVRERAEARRIVVTVAEHETGAVKRFAEASDLA